MRILPNMAIMAPGDPVEVKALLRCIYLRNGPAYMRIAKRGEPNVHPVHSNVVLGKAHRMVDGNDVSIFVCGRQLPNALAASEMLRRDGINSRVLSFHTLKPLDKVAIREAARETKLMVTVEEHSILGGLGSAVAEVMAEERLNLQLLRCGVPDEFQKGVGSQEYFLERYGLTPKGIAGSIKSKF